MFSKHNYINISSLIIILFVNSLFFFKYSVIYVAYPFLLTGLYLLFITLIILRIAKSSNNLIKNKIIIKSAAFLIPAVTLIYIIIFPAFGEIGRQPAINDWLSRLINGHFPYISPNIPSSYPALFFFSFPFYIIGNTGLLEFLGVVLFFYLIYYTVKKDNTSLAPLIKTLTFLLSIVVLYEIVTRSELFFNMMLVALVVYICEKHLDVKKINTRFILSAVLTGMVLSTRSVTALLFLIYFIFRFKYEIRNLIIYGIISVMVFLSFLLPFYIWDAELFIKSGPFAVQSNASNLSFIFILLIFLTGLYSGWIISNVREFFFSGGLILFAAALISFLMRVTEIGINVALINDGYDIAYFILCVPLLILSIEDEGYTMVIQ
jgi:hypothetical protein